MLRFIYLMVTRWLQDLLLLHPRNPRSLRSRLKCAIKQRSDSYIPALKAEYRNNGLHLLADNFILYRIIGNDLYPRHEKGQSRRNLQFILKNEPALIDCEIRWVINRIIDQDEEEKIIKLLEEYDQSFIHIPFIAEEYRTIGFDTDCLPYPEYLFSKSYDRLDQEQRNRRITAVYRLKNNYVMNNNGARNVALREGKTHAKWVLPWDGNCYLTTAAWEQIRNDVITSTWLKYFYVPMARVVDNSHLLDKSFAPDPSEEPQLIFRSDTGEEFNEVYYYGRRPKVELFWRLGIPGNWNNWRLDPWDQMPLPLSKDVCEFGSAGWVARLSSGMAPLELSDKANSRNRGLVRQKAIVSFLQNVDRQVLAHSPDAETLTSFDMAALDYECRKVVEGKDPLLSKTFKRLLAEADDALHRGPFSVTDKTTLPPSGDIHDYWHPAPYWWPNLARKNGLPYIRRGGERAPGTRMYEPQSEQFDSTRLKRVFDDSITLALAWKFTGEEKYAGHGMKILRTFFVDPATRMNPHLNYAQVRLGHANNIGNSYGIIEMKDLYYYLDAVRILAGASPDNNILSDFRHWLNDYLQWLLDSPQGKKECRSYNNHGTYYDLQVASIAAFLDNQPLLYETLIRAQTRMPLQFSSDGSQPEELDRPSSTHYCCFNFQGWINLAEIAGRWGVDLWKYKDKSGASLEKGARWLLNYMGKPWPYQQIEQFDPDRFYPILVACIQNIDSFSQEPAKPVNPYAIKSRFFLHDGIRPYWNLGSYSKHP